MRQPRGECARSFRHRSKQLEQTDGTLRNQRDFGIRTKVKNFLPQWREYLPLKHNRNFVTATSCRLDCADSSSFKGDPDRFHLPDPLR
jgi:hypothetical protein